MPPALIGIILQNVIPQVALIFRSFHAANGTSPTDAQVIAILQLDAETEIAKGQAFLASKGA